MRTTGNTDGLKASRSPRAEPRPPAPSSVVTPNVVVAGADAPRSLFETEAQLPALPPVMGKPVDPHLFTLEPGVRHASRAEWRKRVDEREGKPSLVLLGPLDPSKKVLLVSPGRDASFQHLHALAKLEDTYQVVVGVYDDLDDVQKGGHALASALTEFMDYRTEMAQAQGLTEKPSQELKIVGHSMGGVVWQHALDALVRGKELRDGRKSRYGDVTFVPVDSPWRGVDLPRGVASWRALPLVVELVRALKIRNPWGTPDFAMTSLLNGSKAMNALQEVQLPKRVRTELFTVRGNGVHDLTRFFDPVRNWFSDELHPGELAHIWNFFRSDQSNDLKGLDRPLLGGVVNVQGLQQLIRTLLLDAEGKGVLEELRNVAKQAPDLASFQKAYDAAIERRVTAFEGEHTDFMWENPAFLIKLREVLAR